MKIAYKKSYLINTLMGSFSLLGIMIVRIIIINLYFSQPIVLEDFSYLIMPAFFYLTYLYMKNYQYLTLNKNSITENIPFGKRIEFKDIIELDTDKNNFILKTELKHIKIYSNLVEENSLSKLRTVLDIIKQKNEI